jgi:RNA recognition motif-containing protein
MPSLCRLDFDAVVAVHAPVHAHTPHWQQPARAFTNVFVKNFREDVTDEQFKQAFAGFGAITSAVVARDESGKSKRHGFVNFEAAEAALKCTQLLHGSTALAAEGEAIDVVEHLKKSERFAPAPYAKQHHPKVPRRRLHPPARRVARLIFSTRRLHTTRLPPQQTEPVPGAQGPRKTRQKRLPHARRRR